MKEEPELSNEEKLKLINQSANQALQLLESPGQTVATYLLQIASLSDIHQTRLHVDWAIKMGGGCG